MVPEIGDGRVRALLQGRIGIEGLAREGKSPFMDAYAVGHRDDAERYRLGGTGTAGHKGQGQGGKDGCFFHRYT